MSADSTTKNPIFIVAVAIVAVLGIAAVFSALPERMPPDPFEGEEPREVVLEVTWDGSSRVQNIVYEIGSEVEAVEAGTETTEGETSEGFGGWHWRHVTVAYQGQRARLSAIQSLPGPIMCAVYVNEVLLHSDEGTGKDGCVAQAVIP